MVMSTVTIGMRGGKLIFFLPSPLRPYGGVNVGLAKRIVFKDFFVVSQSYG